MTHDPICPLQLDAHADWNANTGATSHMTPHRYWLRNYAPKHVAIKLADNNIVYSTGVGTMVFSIQITLGDDSQCTDIIVYLTNTDLGDDSQCTRGKAVQLQIKYLSR